MKGPLEGQTTMYKHARSKGGGSNPINHFPLPCIAPVMTCSSVCGARRSVSWRPSFCFAGMPLFFVFVLDRRLFVLAVSGIRVGRVD